MRLPLVAGNWKMHKTIAEARQLVPELVYGLQDIEGVQKVLCPPFTALLSVKALLEGTDIGLGAQNMFWETEGAYTGEVSPKMVAELCQYVILGHSERRIYFGETDEGVRRKVKAALAVGLSPIVCVGETLEENENGKTEVVVRRQLEEGLRGVELEVDESGGVPLLVAYEPVWAIGTGKAASGEIANRVVEEVIRPTLASLYGERVAQAVRVLYGGSVKAANAAEFFEQPGIDGALVGGASLKAEEFIGIVSAAASSKQRQLT
ncbi:MAG: triose-phosphate isomerase [Anaerolineales bacterium]|nr:triose-phosphate isomerase [Anaerolineales bacterium]MCS7247969.1 triose-phosphate isomerase [Anaerolineales bacterium]